MHENWQKLLGTWKLTAAYLVIEETGERHEYLGANPQGTLTFDPSERMVALLTRSDREVADTDAGKAALYQAMLAYGGKVSVEEDTFATTVDVAWTPGWVGTEQTRSYALTGEGLTLRNGPTPHPGMQGKTVTAYLDWVRAD